MPKRPVSQIEIGRTGLKRHYGYIYDEFLSSLRGTRGIKTYKEMRENDPIIGACMHAITQILREARWDVKKADGGQGADAEFLEGCMAGMTHSWSDFMSNVLSMLPYGYSLFEQVFFKRDDSQIGWKKLAPRSQTSLEHWDFDEYGDVLGFYQRPAPTYTEFYLPLLKCLHFRTESNNNNPEGRSILRSAFRPWFFKKNIEEIEGIGIERDLTGLPMMTLPEGVDPNSTDLEVIASITSAKELISRVRRDEQDGILKPYGWEFALLSSPGQRQIDTVSVINRYNKEIAVTVLAQFVMLGMERTGSYALAKEQTDMFYLCLEGWADSIATTFNRQAVPLLFKVNGIVGRPLPYIVHTSIRRHTLKDVSSYVSQLASHEALVIDDDIKAFLKSYARLSEYSEAKK